jgi:3-oxoacyl-[acyl-carrier-protein] synthase III
MVPSWNFTVRPTSFKATTVPTDWANNDLKIIVLTVGFTANDVDQVLFTQISKRTIAIAAERCGVPMEKCHTIMEKYGYTGSACIPMALDDAIELGKIKRGDLVVMISSGLGYNQAAAAVRMTL